MTYSNTDKCPQVEGQFLNVFLMSRIERNEKAEFFPTYPIEDNKNGYVMFHTFNKLLASRKKALKPLSITIQTLKCLKLFRYRGSDKVVGRK